MKNDMKPLVSVIMAVYNGQEYLQKTIDSLLRQNYKNIELIIVDDGSTDATFAILTSLIDERVKIVRNDTNKRLAYSLNKAISLSKGTYIARMDADDICMPNRITLQVEFLEKHRDVDVLGGNFKAFGATSRKSDYFEKHEWIKAGLMFENTMCHPTIMFRKSAIKEWYDPSFEASQDYDLWVRLIYSNMFSNLKNVLIRYRVHDGQTVKTMSAQQKNRANIARRRMLDKTLFSEEEKDLIIEFANFPCQLTLDQFVAYCKVLEGGMDKCNGINICAYKFYMNKCIWTNVIGQYGSDQYYTIVKYAFVHYWKFLLKRPRTIYYVGKGLLK